LGDGKSIPDDLNHWEHWKLQTNTQICHDRCERQLCSAGEWNVTEVISYHKTELTKTHKCADFTDN